MKILDTKALNSEQRALYRHESHRKKVLEGKGGIFL